MNLYQKNINVLSSILGDAEVRRETLEKTSYEGYVSYNQQGIVGVQRQGEWYPLTSRRPKEETVWLTQKIDFNKDNLILVYGIANIELLKYLVKSMSSGSRLVVFESDMQVMKFCLEQEDYTFLAVPEHCYLIASKEYDVLIEKELRIVELLGWEKLVYNIQTIMLPNSSYGREFFHKCILEIKEIMSSEIKKAGNSLSDMFHGLKNDYLNIRHFVECNSVNEVIGKFKGYPAIIVAAGPSLEKNISHIQETKGKALILACDASVDACKKYGVVPDAVASIERVEATYRLYYKEKEFDKDMVLLGPTLLHPELLEEYPGKKVLYQKVDHGMDVLVGESFKQIEYYDIGTSCAHVAFETAMLAGCNPIVLIGQDLAFTDDKLHSDITHTKYEGANNDRRFDGTYVEGVYGEPVKSNDIFNWFRSWFESQMLMHPEVTYIDATEGGAKIGGTQIMTFQEVIAKYCVKDMPYNMHQCLEDRQVTTEDYLREYSEFQRRISKVISKIEIIQRDAEAYYKKLEEIYDRKIEQMNKKELNKVIQEMNEGTKLVQNISLDTEVYSFFAQLILQTMYRVKAIGNDVTNENVMKNLKLQGNLMGMIMRSCSVIIGQYEEAKSYVQEQLESLEK